MSSYPHRVRTFPITIQSIALSLFFASCSCKVRDPSANQSIPSAAVASSAQVLGTNADAATKGPFSHIRLFFDGSSADAPDSLLDQGVADHIRAKIHSTMMAYFPELGDLPPDRFEQALAFSINLIHSGFFSVKIGVRISLHVGEMKIGHPSRQGIMVEGAGRTASMAVVDNNALFLANHTSRIDEHVDTRWLGKHQRTVLSKAAIRVADIIDFRPSISADGLKAQILAMFPELTPYFQVQRILVAAVQNPDTTADVLRQSLASTEISLRNLLAEKQISEVDLNERIANARRELATLEADMARVRDELARTSQNRDNAIHELEQARLLLNDLLLDRQQGVVQILDRMKNLEIVSSSESPEGDRKLQDMVNSRVHAFLTTTLEHEVLAYGRDWEAENVRVRVSTAVVYHERKMIKSGFLSPAVPSDTIRFVLGGVVSTPSHSFALPSTEVELTMQQGKPAGIEDREFELSIASFFRDTPEVVRRAILSERAEPKKSQLAELLQALQDDGISMADAVSMCRALARKASN